MILSPPDFALETRKRQAEELLGGLSLGLEALRGSLERWSAQDAASSVTERDALAQDLHRLATMLEWEISPAGVQAWTDRESLQGFRRHALADLEGLRGRYAKLCAGPWRTAADEARERVVRTTARRWALPLCLCATLLAAWWGWQGWRQQAAEAEMDLARRDRAAQAVALIASTARRAQAAQGKLLTDMAQDMSQDCSGIDTRTILPNHPCRQAWDKNAQALFRASIPAPGAPVDAPSQVFTDPWGSPYVLLIPVQGKAKVVSPGPDGRVGTPDDVSADID
jgi:type II secretory pathway pseudopilin PulG